MDSNYAEVFLSMLKPNPKRKPGADVSQHMAFNSEKITFKPRRTFALRSTRSCREKQFDVGENKRTRKD